MNEALKAGADGIVLISSLGRGIQGDFFKSIKQISEGGTYYPQEIRAVVSNPPCLLPELSERETETLVALVEGLSNQLISEKLFISLDTVKSHVRSIMSKMNARDRTQVVIAAIRSGM